MIGGQIHILVLMTAHTPDLIIGYLNWCPLNSPRKDEPNG